MSGACRQKASILIRALPEDTVACFYIRNLKSFSEKWKSHPFNAYTHELFAGKSKQTGKSRKSGRFDTRKNGEKSFSDAIEEELGVSLEKIPDIFPGQWAVAMIGSDIEDFLETDGRKKKRKDLPLVSLMEHNGDTDAIVSMIRSSAAFDAKKEGSKHRIVEERYLGASLYIEEIEKNNHVYDAGGYAIAGNVFVMATKIPRLKETVARLYEKDEQSIYDSKRFSDAMDRIGKDDAYFYIDLAMPVKWIRRAAIKFGRKNRSGGQKQNGPQFFSPQRFLSALHLESFAAIFAGIDVSDPVSRIDSGLFLNDRKGMASLLRYGRGPLRLPDYIADDVVGARVSLFDLPHFLTRLESLVNTAMPMAGGIYNGYLAQIKAETGVDVKESLLKNLGPGITIIDFNRDISPAAAGSARKYSENKTSQVVGISISDRQGFTTAVEAIKTIIGGPDRFQKQTYLGYDIYTLKNPAQTTGPIQGISYAVCDDTCFFANGGVDGIKKVIARLKRPGKTIWQTDTLKKAFKMLPPGNVAISYVDLGHFLKSMASVSRFAEMGLEHGKKRAFNLDENNLPGIPFCLVSAVYFEKQGLFSHALVLKKEQ